MGRKVGTCTECGEMNVVIKAKGRCAKCDQAYRRKKEEDDLVGVLGAFASRGHQRRVKEEDHLLESVTKIIKTVNAEPGFSEEDTVAMKMMMQRYLRERAESLVPQKFLEPESTPTELESTKSTVNTKSESTVDSEQESELLALS